MCVNLCCECVFLDCLYVLFLYFPVCFLTRGKRPWSWKDGEERRGDEGGENDQNIPSEKDLLSIKRK